MLGRGSAPGTSHRAGKEFLQGNSNLDSPAQFLTTKFLPCKLPWLKGSNGDKLEFSYVGGVRVGAAVYTFADGSQEVSTYNDKGEQSGPAKFIWTNGAVREGQKVFIASVLFKLKIPPCPLSRSMVSGMVRCFTRTLRVLELARKMLNSGWTV